MTPFFMAWNMFMWIPSPSHKWDEDKKKEMLLCMPLIGLIIGFLWAFIGWLLLWKLRKFEDTLAIRSAIFAVTPWLITGFMHIDGYMDCADAALCFKSKEKKLEILKDSHTGSFAVVSMVILGILQFAACCSLKINNSNFLVFIFVPMLTRALSVFNIFRGNALPKSSYKSMLEGKIRKIYYIVPLIIILIGLGAIEILVNIDFLICTLIGLLVENLIILYLKNNLGGISGDVSGAAITGGELAILIAYSFII